MDCCNAWTLSTLIQVPIIAVSLILISVTWITFTVSLIGPVLNLILTSLDKRILNREKLLYHFDTRQVIVPADIHSCSMGSTYCVFIRLSHPIHPSIYPPVCIPNGLGASVITTSRIHEILVERGFTTLSYDRLGVGLSDENKSGKAPTALDVVKEMDFIMSSVMPSDTKWILVGPSMGSVIAQCYIATFPYKVVGFLNLDGVPYPFVSFRKQFEWCSAVYRMYSMIVWTGIFRPFIALLMFYKGSMFDSRAFSSTYSQAILNQTRFYQNIATEMITMMNCCEMAEAGWGGQSLLRLERKHLEALICAEPNRSIKFEEKSGESRIVTERSESELGSRWANAKYVTSALTKLKNNNQILPHNNNGGGAVVNNPNMYAPPRASNLEDEFEPLMESSISMTSRATFMSDKLDVVSLTAASSILGYQWPKLVVRVMSARNHDFGSSFINSFYTREMKDFAAAEHAVHALLAKDGGRTVYPTISHFSLWTYSKEVARNVEEIAMQLSVFK
eukprot:gene9975-13417_t